MFSLAHLNLRELRKRVHFADTEQSELCARVLFNGKDVDSHLGRPSFRQAPRIKAYYYWFH